MTEESRPSRNPWVWVSVIYFAEGFPYTLVNLVSVVFLKDLGASNELIGLTSFLYLPWVLKGLWGPVVDIYSTRRRWILATELICTFLFFVLAAFSFSPNILPVSIAVFAFIALASATHDIAIDGFYLDALDKDRQALFVGVRTTTYKLSWLFGNGGLVFLAGSIAQKYLAGTNEAGVKQYSDLSLPILGAVHPVEFGWASAFALSGVIFVLIYLFQLWYLPTPASSRQAAADVDNGPKFIEAFKSYFTQNKIAWIVSYVLIFRLGDAFMLKMAPPFLMDGAAKGGLAITTQEMGILSGTVGSVALLAGGIIGGVLIAKQGLRRWMWPTAIVQNSAIILYWLLAVYKPTLGWVYVANAYEQFSYGLGVSAYTVFLMRTIRPEFKASHYAITTAFMAAGVLIPGVFSGFLQTRMGYDNYFLMSFLVAIPGLCTIPFLPLEEKT